MNPPEIVKNKYSNDKIILCSIKFAKSIIIVENVVNDPMIPVVKKVITYLLSFNLSIDTDKIKASKNEPHILTVNVSIGKVNVSVFNKRDKLYLNNDPIIPPSPTEKTSFKTFLFIIDMLDITHTLQIYDLILYIGSVMMLYDP